MPEPPRDIPVLEYQAPKENGGYRFWPALLLCLPGILCWIVLLTQAVPISFSTFMLLWVLAIITAIWSLVLYGRRPRERKPWYVLVCVGLNLIGLGLSVVVVVMMF